MSGSIKAVIQNRKSVRTFDGRALSAADTEKLTQLIQTADNPFGAAVRFRLLNAKEHRLTSAVIVGAPCYLAAKVRRVPRYEIAFGYSFEKACLCAHSLGLGTVILAGTLNRSAFEQAMDLEDGEILPAAAPVGYPAKRRSVRDNLMRKGLKSDERLPFERLFFENDFSQPLSNESPFAEALEMTRLAPSATNKQPWRAVVCGNTVHFYEYKTMKDSPLGDVQKVDMGIALAHFDLTMAENGCSGQFFETAPPVEAPENTHYIISYEMAE